MLAALIRSGWKIYGKDGAAQLLAIKPTTLIERMRRLGIKKPG
jgi:transcriptional regulator with GAF, ATPase, and Fis domain